MQYVDANVFLRFILDDNREMADYAEELLAKHQAFALPEVIAETKWRSSLVDSVKTFDDLDKFVQSSRGVTKFSGNPKVVL